jgi:hypothetical protein
LADTLAHATPRTLVQCGWAAVAGAVAASPGSYSPAAVAVVLPPLVDALLAHDGRAVLPGGGGAAPPPPPLAAAAVGGALPQLLPHAAALLRESCEAVEPGRARVRLHASAFKPGETAVVMCAAARLERWAAAREGDRRVEHAAPLPWLSVPRWPREGWVVGGGDGGGVLPWPPPAPPPSADVALELAALLPLLCETAVVQCRDGMKPHTAAALLAAAVSAGASAGECTGAAAGVQPRHVALVAVELGRSLQRGGTGAAAAAAAAAAPAAAAPVPPQARGDVDAATLSATAVWALAHLHGGAPAARAAAPGRPPPPPPTAGAYAEEAELARLAGDAGGLELPQLALLVAAAAVCQRPQPAGVVAALLQRVRDRLGGPRGPPPAPDALLTLAWAAPVAAVRSGAYVAGGATGGAEGVGDALAAVAAAVGDGHVLGSDAVAGWAAGVLRATLAPRAAGAAQWVGPPPSAVPAVRSACGEWERALAGGGAGRRAPRA